MAQVELLMPKMGESIFEATILTWIKKPGDKIEQDESVLEVATDKVDTEVPTTHAGVLKEIIAKEGDVVKIGSPIAIISTNGEADGAIAQPISETKKVVESTQQLSQPVHSSNGNGTSHESDY